MASGCNKPEAAYCIRNLREARQGAGTPFHFFEGFLRHDRRAFLYDSGKGIANAADKWCGMVLAI